MSDASRRSFLAVAGAGAAAGTVGITAGGAAAASSARSKSSEPVVVYIEEPRSDRLTIMVGDEEVELRDRDLIARIIRAAGGN